MQKNPTEVETSKGGGQPGQPEKTLKDERPRELLPRISGETGVCKVVRLGGCKAPRSAKDQDGSQLSLESQGLFSNTVVEG
jgi:hypothetical protein